MFFYQRPGIFISRENPKSLTSARLVMRLTRQQDLPRGNLDQMYEFLREQGSKKNPETDKIAGNIRKEISAGTVATISV
jgi:hypothetical protein